MTKLMGITEAQQKCPELVLVSGEDLTPYRLVFIALQAGLSLGGLDAQQQTLTLAGKQASAY